MTDHSDTIIQSAGDGETEAALRELEHAADQLHIPPVGTTIDDRYKIIEHLGSGGYGLVFKVEHLFLGQFFAMKILAHRFAVDPEWLVRFRQEAKATSAIGHENIVFVTDFGTCDDYGQYLVMELLEGDSLAEVIANGPLDVDRVIRFAIAAGSALSAVHELGIVHCDLKPKNAMLVADGETEVWKILDFGTSTLVTESVDSEKVFGTPRYMAPEQALGYRVDHRADQFSLACMLYEMLCEKPPWPTRVWNEAMPKFRQSKEVYPPSHLRDDCPEPIDDVIMRALSMRREDRYGSIDEFVEALQAAAPVELIPTADPMDVSESENKFIRTRTAPAVELPGFMKLSDGTSESNDRTIITFSSASRLRREYRRNLIAGRLFAPTSDAPPKIGSTIKIEIQYSPTDVSCHLDGKVVAGNSTRPGFGVAFDEESLPILRLFLRNLRLGITLAQNDIVRRVQQSDDRPSLNAGELFLLARMTGEMPVGRLRSMCSGMPFSIEEIIASLLKKSLVEMQHGGNETSGFFIEGSATQQVSKPDTVDESWLDVGLSNDEVDDLVQLADFFVEIQNYLAAIDLLEKALELAPERPSLHFQLAQLYEKFVNDTAAAKIHMSQALKLSPKNRIYRTYMTKLSKGAAEVDSTTS